MTAQLRENIEKFQNFEVISALRRIILQPMIDYIQQKINNKEDINLHFICTHNSRRSHFAQVWAQVAANHYCIPNVCCYSGGTEETALFPEVRDTLNKQGLQIFPITEGDNPIYAIKYTKNSMPIIGFSKTYDHAFNPTSAFAAILTCSQADQGCPYIEGAEIRIPVTYEDPKVSDGTPDQPQLYEKTSIEIATEMMFIFSSISR